MGHPVPDGHAERLHAERAAALARSQALRGDAAAIAASVAMDPPDDEHDPEGATLAFEREQATALADTAAARVAAVDAALTRVAAGTAGTCGACGGPIGAPRLAARPVTDRCVACAERGSARRVR